MKTPGYLDGCKSFLGDCSNRRFTLMVSYREQTKRNKKKFVFYDLRQNDLMNFS